VNGLIPVKLIFLTLPDTAWYYSLCVLLCSFVSDGQIDLKLDSFVYSFTAVFQVYLGLPAIPRRSDGSS